METRSYSLPVAPGSPTIPKLAYHPPEIAGLSLFISGITSRRPDGTIGGVQDNSDGSFSLDAAEQTSVILENIEAIIKQATNNQGGLSNVIDATIFLTSLRKDYAGMNQVWNKTWGDARIAPARTCVGVAELPSPKLAVEFKVTVLIDDV